MNASQLEGKTVYVVDAHSLIYQVFHAVAEMTGPAGQPVNAVFGFTRDMMDLLDRCRPDYLFCAFDAPGRTFRHEKYEQYKIHRPEMPEDLRPQIASIHRFLAGMKIPVLEQSPYEADDILATVARQVEELGGECVLVTGDKDCRQLISDKTRLYNIRKDELIDAETLARQWGIRPDQVVDFQALVGDTSDNVPGVDQVGPKTAGELLRKYGDLETLLARAEEVPRKRARENLLRGADVARLSRDLVRLIPDIPLTIDWEAGRVGDFDRETLAELLREFGFRQFLERLGEMDGVEAPKTWQADYRTIDEMDELAALVDRLAGARRISLDTETTHTSPRWADLVGISLADEPGRSYYIPVRGPADEKTLDEAKVLAAIRPLLEDAAVEKIGQNLKYDQVVLRGCGIELAGVAFDTMVADYLLEAGSRSHGLNELAQRYLNHAPIKISELIGTGRNQRRMDEVPVAKVAPYAAEDADIPLRLTPLLERRLREAELDGLFATVEMPLVGVLAEMEFNGVRIDVDRLAELSREYSRRMQRLEGEIYEIAGRRFNIASPKQLQKILFDDLGLPVLKKTKTGASTDAEVLAELARQHALPAKIIEYRQYAKLKNTYIDALPEMVCPKTDRVHTSLNQVVAATGRLSSNEPNLQNIPVRTQEGREIRSAFIPGAAGWQLLTADYSQIELRVLAHFSQDEALLDAFRGDEDIHARVASEVYGVPLSEVSREQRRSAKAINFGIVYGQSPFGLARAIDISRDEAAEYIDAYFARYPGVEAFMNELLIRCREQGYVTTILGRRRKIDGVRSEERRRQNPRQRTLPERTAINTVIQGSAADLIKLAMLAVSDRLRARQHPARMLLQIHDELIFETPGDSVDELAEMVIEAMGSVGELRVPLKIDVKAGSNWEACEPV